jgi:hypothetical protein
MLTETHFQKELEELKENLLKMTAVVDALVINHHADEKKEEAGT